MKLSVNKVAIKSNVIFKSNAKQKQPQTIAVLGNSRANSSIMEYMSLCADVTKSIVINGNSVIHGCGKYGIMGSAYNSAAKYSTKDENGKPEQNLAIIKEPLWGDEDLDNCVVKGISSSEAERIEMFSDNADKFLIFPGSAATMQEITTLISKNNYTPAEKRKKIVLVGKDYFDGLSKQYEAIYKSGLLNDKPQNLFTIVDDEKEILHALD